MGIETPRNNPEQFFGPDEAKWERELQESARKKIDAFLQAGDKENAEKTLEQLNKDLAAKLEEEEKGN